MLNLAATMGTNQLLQSYHKELGRKSLGIDRNAEWALYHLLLAHEKEITGLVEGDPWRFHKMFRQVDVLENGNVQVAIWLLIHEAPIFLSVLERFAEDWEKMRAI